MENNNAESFLLQDHKDNKHQKYSFLSKNENCDHLLTLVQQNTRENILNNISPFFIHTRKSVESKTALDHNDFYCFEKKGGEKKSHEGK